jgi:ubiquinone/menaquinone biosynthesis C-methylase UbiE
VRLARLLCSATFAVVLIACGSQPLFSTVHEDDAQRIVEKLGVSSGATVGEIGGGSGDLALAVATHLGAQGHLLVTELNKDQVSRMRSRFANSKGVQMEVLDAGTDTTELPDACCDGLYMRDVYHHFTKPASMVASLYGNLKPGGRLVVIDFRPRTGGSWSTPEGVPANRGGHGIPIAVLREELEAGGFRHLETIEKWRDNLFAVIVEKPR